MKNPCFSLIQMQDEIHKLPNLHLASLTECRMFVFYTAHSDLAKLHVFHCVFFIFLQFFLPSPVQMQLIPCKITVGVQLLFFRVLNQCNTPFLRNFRNLHSCDLKGDSLFASVLWHCHQIHRNISSFLKSKKVHIFH